MDNPKTYTWEEIEAAHNKHLDHIKKTIEKQPRLIQNLPANHPAQAAAKAQRLAQIERGTIVTLQFIKSILKTGEISQPEKPKVEDHEEKDELDPESEMHRSQARVEREIFKDTKPEDIPL